MKNIGNYFVGGSLIFIGGLFLLNQTVEGFSINWQIIWPIFILFPGIIFWISWLSMPNRRENWGALIPANVLTFLAITFFVNTIISETRNYNLIWVLTIFMYPGSIALAFFITSILGKNAKGLRIVSLILGVISIILFVLFTLGTGVAAIFTSDVGRWFFPILLIIIGLVMLFSKAVEEQMKSDEKFLDKSKKDWEEWGENLGENIKRSIEGTGHSKK